MKLDQIGAAKQKPDQKVSKTLYQEMSFSLF